MRRIANNGSTYSKGTDTSMIRVEATGDDDLHFSNDINNQSTFNNNGRDNRRPLSNTVRDKSDVSRKNIEAELDDDSGKDKRR